MELSQKFVRTIAGMFAAAGEKWLEGLPEIVADVAAKWELRVGPPFANLSYHYVAPCICRDGAEAVLKIGFPGEETEFLREVKTLELYAGQGTVKLFNDDKINFAMLLEKISPGESLGELCLDDDQKAVKIAADILQRMVREVSNPGEFHLLDNWMNGLERKNGARFPEKAIAKARGYYRRLNKKSEHKLLHGDFHHENILSAKREPYLVIDPKGLVGNTGYDAGVFLNNHRNWLEGLPNLEAKLASAVEQFAEALNLSDENLRKWAFVQMVLSAFWTFEENDERWKRELSKADVWQV